MNREKDGCLFALLSALGLAPPQRSDRRDKNIDSLPVDTSDDDRTMEFVDGELVEELPYRIRDDFLSPAERSFFGVLVLTVGQRAIVCPKVRLGDIFYTPGRQQNWKHNNRVNQKHVDFLICTCDTIRPLVGIELDDRSHQREDRHERDQFKDAAFEAAGLPLVRFQTKRSYNQQEILNILLPYIQVSAMPGATPFASLATAAQPTCPKCGVPMVLRTATRGDQAGNQFYGCPNFPKCREIIASQP